MADLGVESVTVPAGTFDASHLAVHLGRRRLQRVGRAQASDPYGLVKSASEEFEMVLVAHGDKAVTLITETPQALPMKGFPCRGWAGSREQKGAARQHARLREANRPDRVARAVSVWRRGSTAGHFGSTGSPAVTQAS